MLGAPVVPHDEASLMCVAAEQSGLLTRAQCLAAGMTDPAIRWRLSRGHWIAVHHGVYLTVRGRDDWRTGAVAAQLAVDGSAWSHRSAAFVHGLNAVPPEHIDLVIDARHRIRPPRGSCCIDERTPMTPLILCIGRGEPRWRRPCSM